MSKDNKTQRAKAVWRQLEVAKSIISSLHSSHFWAKCIFGLTHVEMFLDTRQTFHQIYNGDGKKFTEQLLEISKHTVSQDEAVVWAKNLRFIAVPKELDLRIARRNSAVTVLKKEDEKDLRDAVSVDKKVNVKLNCICDQWPKFPHQELPHLALTHIGDIQNCDHHVAVSYCWMGAVRGRHESVPTARSLGINSKGHELRPSKRQRLTPKPAEKSPNMPYDIMTGRGMRRGRVPRDIMDRALCYAANKELSFIWIDQECIEQDDPVEKELAIQSMHLVYRRSEFPLGLLNTKLVKQQHIDALDFAIKYSSGESFLRDADAKSEGFSGIPGRERPIHSFIRNFAEVLKIMSRDKWLTRGWIMQEMVLAGEKMVFSLLCDPSLKKPFWGGDVDGELHFTLEQLVPIFDDVLSSDAKSREFDKLISTMDKRLNVGQAIYASYRKLRHITLGTNAGGEKSINGPYRVCNPLAAVLYLEGRSNSRNGDRLAIVANLCDYAVRLNSTKLDELGFGYSTCLLALMLLNGDVTYMIEWAKGINQPKNDTSTVNEPTALLDLQWDPSIAYSWMPAPHNSLSLSLTYDQFIDNGNLALATIMDPIMQVFDTRLSGSGLHLRGWTWHVSEKLDLHHFQRSLMKSWPSILKQAEVLDDFASLAAPVAKLILELFSTMLKAEVKDLTELLWRHLVLNYLGDLSETEDDLETKFILPKALTPLLPQLRHIVSQLGAGASNLGKNSVSPHLIIRLLLMRLEERSTAPTEVEWVFNLVMTQGYLRWGRTSGKPGSDSHEGRDRAVAIFDCSDMNLIMTPQMLDPTKDAIERREWMRHFRQQPGSWIVESQNKTIIPDKNVPVFTTKGMVRGLWRIGEVQPNPCVLS